MENKTIKEMEEYKKKEIIVDLLSKRYILNQDIKRYSSMRRANLKYDVEEVCMDKIEICNSKIDMIISEIEELINR